MGATALDHSDLLKVWEKPALTRSEKGVKADSHCLNHCYFDPHLAETLPTNPLSAIVR